MIATKVRVVRGKPRRRRSEKRRWWTTLRQEEHQFIGGFSSSAGQHFLRTQLDEARRNGRPL